uniref:ELF6 n=1 Tax=Arundo donax TaxID=35708 RepID=A0A0A9HN57_ARUDO
MQGWRSRRWWDWRRQRMTRRRGSG